MSAAKASTQQATARKSGEPAGSDTDFSQVLAKSQPKKEIDPAPGSDAPAPAAKVAGKKPAKAKGKADQADDAQPAAIDATANRSNVDPENAGPAPLDNEVPVADLNGESDCHAPSKDETPSDKERQPAVHFDPTQMIVPATPPQVQVQAEVRQDAAADDAPVATPANAAPVETLPPIAKDGLTPADDRNDAGKPVGQDQAAPRPVATAEMKVAVRPVNQADEQSAEGDPDGAEVRAQGKPNASPLATADSPVAQFNELFQAATDRIAADGTEKSADKAASPMDVALAAISNNAPATQAAETKPAPVAPAPVAPEVRFAEDNHPKVVTAVKTQLLPGGGSIQLRLDPPDLGPLRLEVRMEDGAMSASFVTASDHATSLLTHSLGQLKHALEAAGISVDKLQVRQGSAEQFSENSEQQRQGETGDQSSARQEQQRREMLNRMWQKVAGGDPLDLVA